MLIDRKITSPLPGTLDNTGTYDNYYSRLIKLIPAELIALYLALDGIVSAMPQKQVLLWVVFGISLAGGWFYLVRLAHVTSIGQRLLTLLALSIWIYLIGGPFATLAWYNEAWGKLAVVLYTFFVPLFFRGSSA
jgi:hypothetical protein